MPRTPGETRARNIETVWLRVRRHPDGITEAEVAKLTGFERRTAHNYLTELHEEGKIDKEGTLWFPVEYEETRLRALDLSPEEAYALYLGSRLLIKQHDKRNEPAENALLKLADALTSDADVGDEIAQAAALLAQRPSRPGYQSVFTTMTRGYIYRRTVELTYRPLKGRSFTTRFRTYLMEPSPIGYTTYVIGHSSAPDALRAYKLERIQEARLLREPYQIPPDFPGLEILTNAWSIYFGEETTQVELRFAPEVRERVLETQWHPSQCTQEDSERPGWLRWSAQVADTTDMLPWIRGWGAACEVIGPSELRETLEDEARRIGRLYRVESNLAKPPLHHLLWAKTGTDEQTHPLLFHMIDVGYVTLALWQKVLGASFRLETATKFGLTVDETGRLLAFWAALHDLGKASPYFQCKHRPSIEAQKAAGLTFPTRFGQEKCYHAVITALTLPELLQRYTGIPEDWASDIAQALGGHHGSWPTYQVRRNHRKQKGNSVWDELRASLIQELITVFAPPALEEMEQCPDDRNRILVLFSGLVSVSDWLGSMQQHFPMTPAEIPLTHYVKRAHRRANEVLKQEKWTHQPGTVAPTTFSELFKFEARSAQNTILDNLPQANTPGLVIIEAQTGIGKTEMSLYLADHWMVGQGQRGLYVAMPTMATSNQMFGRVGNYLETRYPQKEINYHLIHSQALWRTDMEDLHPNTVEDESSEPEARLAPATWFLPRKRSLLAPFAVGTVDQALMSVLQTRHFFVRLFGLSHKTVIFDEVHAYDSYMSTIFQRLLEWLRAVGASVVILSATLPAKTRQALVKAYLGDNITPNDTQFLDKATAYPAMTVAGDAGIRITPLPDDESRAITLEWLEPNPDSLVDELKARLAQGGCAAVICNRVARAQEVYKLLAAAELVEPDDLILFHARFPQGRRNEIEQLVLARFGKDATTRPHRSIVVATQVIEQSLDLDFDLMVSDLAPVDLILQRMGRLHRHARGQRPIGVHQPTLCLVSPHTNENRSIDWGGDQYVYEPYILLRSLLALHDAGEQIETPSQTVELIEKVYGDHQADNIFDEQWRAELEQARDTMAENQRKAEFEATRRLISAAQHEDLIWQHNDLLAEENPDIHQSFQALTRLMEPTVSLVCLHAVDDGLAFEPGGMPEIDLEVKPDSTLTRTLAKYVISISNPAVRRHFIAQEPPNGWCDHPLLSSHRVAVFAAGECHLEEAGYMLRISDALGLEIVRTDSASK